MARPTVQRLDNGQLEFMYNFLRMGCGKLGVPLNSGAEKQVKKLEE